ncbi:MAG: desulfoferrodoxin [Kangiellaceae bacterium]|jgi:superoxide reductase|nr:desulfoferrodoxin [Kangiellaceae bacterium]
MIKKSEVYKCEICGNLIEVLHGSKSAIMCCGSAMSLLTENTVDAAKEKHVPAVERIENGVKVSVGQVAHPMEEKHYIEWIEIIDGEKLSRQFLNPHQKPEAIFVTDASDITVRAYCNLHGLWKS